MKEKKRSTWSWVMEFAGIRRWDYILSVVLAVASVLCQMGPYLIMAGMIADLLAGSRELAPMLGKCLLMALLCLLKQVLHALSTTESHRATFYVLGTMRKRALEKLARMPLGEVNAYGSGSLKNILVERIDSIETTLAHILPEFTSNLLVTGLMLVYIFAIDWRMGLAALASIALGMVFFLGMMVDYEPNFQRTVRATKALNDATVEYIGGIEVIKVFGKVKGSYEKFVAAAREGANSYIDWMRKCNVFFALAYSIVPAALLVVLPVGIHLTSSGALMQQELITVLMLSVAIFEPMIVCASYTDDIGVLGTVMDQITGILTGRELDRPAQDEAKPQGCDVAFRDVCFGYGEKEVLHNISFDLKQGTVNALVGPSGSGKTTIARLLESYWDANSGTITVGGADLHSLSQETCAELISYVSQDTFLFDDTVMENIRMGRPGATDDEVIAAAKSCGCHEFILGLEKGYDTVVGGKGSHLSGGERQRISIARAMLKDAPILILDEATAYTDPESEAVLQESIARLAAGKTLLVIAHRLSTIAGADQILLINDGRVEDRGTHSELLLHHGLYERMWRSHISGRDSGADEEEEVRHD